MRSWSFLVGVLLVLISLAPAHAASARPRDTWTSQFVTADGNYADAAYGPIGPAITYTNASGTSAVHFAYLTTSWHTETLSGSIFYGTALPQLAFDGSGDAWIAFHELFPNQIALMHRVGPNTWTTATTVSSASLGDLQLAPDGSMALVYLDDNTDNIVYATWNGSVLSTSTIAGGEPGELHFAGSTPTVSYLDSTGGLSFARLVGTTWTISQAATQANGGPSHDLAPSGKPVIAFLTHNNRQEENLRSARLVGATSWQRDLVDGNGNTGYGCSLRVGADGEILIAYGQWRLNQGQARLKVASRLSGPWTISVITDNLSLMSHQSVVFDPQGVAHIAYSANDGLYWSTRS